MGVLCQLSAWIIIIQDLRYRKINFEVLVVFLVSSIAFIFSNRHLPEIVPDMILTCTRVGIFSVLEKLFLIFRKGDGEKFFYAGDKIVWLTCGMLFSPEKALWMILIGAVFACLWYRFSNRLNKAGSNRFPATVFFALGLFFSLWIS